MMSGIRLKAEFEIEARKRSITQRFQKPSPKHVYALTGMPSIRWIASNKDSRLEIYGDIMDCSLANLKDGH
ncbi:hypothetical protein JTE90_010669 [Oedothorax gibbosus]|uniref:Uncharacterized protein n=1 Tax=Oedothorax gibbosus TaxID=931172 RepID=A0AAV6UR98_9ARAC|nr:hypothetical protein JTE90_010669 [Oedothorax gibbosus]